MRVGGFLVVAGVLSALAGCSNSKAEAERSEAVLEKLGQDDKIPKDAPTEELQALLDEKVENGAIPREQAEKLLKVLESADHHNQRLERMDDQLFGENAL